MTVDWTPIAYELTSEITTTGDGGWQYLVMPNSAEIFGKAKSIKAKGSLDGEPFEATMMPMGGGTHLIPIKAAVRKQIGKELGDTVNLVITEFK